MKDEDYIKMNIGNNEEKEKRGFFTFLKRNKKKVSAIAALIALGIGVELYINNNDDDKNDYMVEPIIVDVNTKDNNEVIKQEENNKDIPKEENIQPNDTTKDEIVQNGEHTTSDLEKNESSIKPSEQVLDARLAQIETNKKTLDLNVTYSTNKLTNENVVVNIKGNESLNKIDGWTLSKDSKTLSKNYTKNTLETLTITSVKGESKDVTINIQNIDKTLPMSSINYSTHRLTNGSVVVTIKSNEEVEPVLGWTLSNDGKCLTKVYNENKTEIVAVKDKAGNTTLVNVVVNNIDKLFEQPKVKYDNLAYGKEKVTIVSNEEMKPIEGWTLSTDKKKLTKTYTSNIEEYVIVSDLANNKKTVLIKISDLTKNNADSISTEPSKPEDPTKPEHTHSHTQLTGSDDNNEYYSCECGDVIKKGHDYDEGVKQSDGSILFTCSNCGHTKTIKHTHSHTKLTGSDDNNEYYSCECGDVIKKRHSFDEGVKQSDGSILFTCSNCGHTKTKAAEKPIEPTKPVDPTKPIEPTKPEHTHSHTQLTGSDDNNEYYSCECGDVIKKGHDYDGGVKQSDGSILFTCSNCGHTKTIKHTHSHTQLTGSDDNNEYYSCECGDVIKKGHDYDGGVTQSDGSVLFTCSNCGHTKTKAAEKPVDPTPDDDRNNVTSDEKDNTGIDSGEQKPDIDIDYSDDDNTEEEDFNFEEEFNLESCNIEDLDTLYAFRELLSEQTYSSSDLKNAMYNISYDILEREDKPYVPLYKLK